ncbi:MAG: c-type cytochrome biogenesis protein CcsB [Smithella sp.]|nr:c-type cytochrome biogenesis protein CcsB [Smithella sp.]
MSHTMLLSYVTFIYFAAFVLYLFRMIFKKEFWGTAASFMAWAGVTAHNLAMILRWKASYNLGFGHVPITNLYESLIFFSWSIMLLYLTIELRIKNRMLGAFVVPVAFLIMAYASIAPGVNQNIEPLIPALQSNWLTSHVLTCFMGYAAFTIAFGCGILYLWKIKKDEAKPDASGWMALMPSLRVLDALIYQSTTLGFVFLALGIVTGSVWAHYAWGSYWSWDPKEIWSLITWLIYAIMLHARFVRGWRGKRMAVLSIIGFASVLFTYLGVNFQTSLHSYI